MKLFLKFFWMGISKLLYVIFCIICLLLPSAVGIISGMLLYTVLNLLLAVLFGVIITIITYCIFFIIVHSIDAVKYCKENKTDSLKDAWEKTAIDWSNF